jgi:hypothetical protein
VPGNFTFLLMTDRHDLDDQIYKTFAGSGIAGKDTPRAGSGHDLERVLKENHPYVFSLIHKFNKDVNSEEPYSERDDIIVISDEAFSISSSVRTTRSTPPTSGSTRSQPIWSSTAPPGGNQASRC